MQLISPTDTNEVCDSVVESISSGKKLKISSGGSKISLCHSIEADTHLNLSKLEGIISYEPNELVLTALPATPISKIEEILFDQGQYLAFEPPRSNGKATLGGVLACNFSGPRRVIAGAARDHFLGVEAVSGRGEIFKSGGRVVKNVTGYDLPKLIAGSWGTLAIMTEVTVKVLPLPETSKTLLILGQDIDSAYLAMNKAISSQYSVTGLAYLPKNVASNSMVEKVSSTMEALTALRIEGPEISVKHQVSGLKGIYIDENLEILDHNQTQKFWSEINEASFFDHNKVIWRISIPPASSPKFSKMISTLSNVEFLFDWAGGRVWLEISQLDPCSNLVRNSVDAIGGHAMLMVNSKDAYSDIPMFHPQKPELFEIESRIKVNFDPMNILNPNIRIS